MPESLAVYVVWVAIPLAMTAPAVVFGYVVAWSNARRKAQRIIARQRRHERSIVAPVDDAGDSGFGGYGGAYGERDWNHREATGQPGPGHIWDDQPDSSIFFRGQGVAAGG